MLYCDRIIFSQGIDVNKANESRKCFIFNNFILLNLNFRFQRRICNNHHNLIQKTVSFNDVAIVSVIIKMIMKMNHNNTYYERNKESLQEKHKSLVSKRWKTEKERRKKAYKQKHEITMENYLMRKKI